MKNQSGLRRLTIQNFTALGVLFVLMANSACREEAVVSSQPPRPVSYVSLQKTNPSHASRLTGTMESWKREDLGFDVAGRVLRVIEPGTNILGRTFDENGKILTEGTVLAEIDDKRYQIALRTAKAAVETAKTELVTVIPEQLKQAQAALDLADKEVERFTKLVRDKAAPKQRLDQVEAAQKVAKAKVASVVALRATKSVAIKTLQTQVRQAEVNIEDCKLRSPFTGQVARVHIIPGGYALPGQAVVTVQMMDPMKVNIAVSASTDKRINQNDLMRVFLPEGEPLEGLVYLKDTFADPVTRTYLVTLLVRNRRILTGVPNNFQSENVAHCKNIWKLEQAEYGSSQNYYAEVEAIRKDSEGYYVWKIENLTREQLYTTFNPVMTVKKVRVIPGQRRIPVLQVFTFRELTNIGELDPKQDVIAGNISGELEDGGKVVLVRERWLGRPGDVVRVGLKGKETPTGFYVPESAIQYDGTNYYIAIVKDHSDGLEQVSKIEVKLAETVGSSRRIDGKLEEGMKVIIEGAHYVNDGETVRTVDELMRTR